MPLTEITELGRDFTISKPFFLLIDTIYWGALAHSMEHTQADRLGARLLQVH